MKQNLGKLDRVLIFGVLLEELIFAFTLGMYWSGMYEHVKWKKPIKT